MEGPEEIPSLDSIADTNDIFQFLWLGTLSSLGGFWGELDDFQFYSTELSPQQVAEMYANPGSLAIINGGAPLQPGDADQDLDFDQLDLVQVQIAAKYLTGNVATWGEGDWNGGPGGSQGSPPAGDGRFDQLDVIAALSAGVYLTGPYGAVAAGRARGDGHISVSDNPATGAVFVDASAERFVLGDSSVTGSLAGGGDPGNVDLVYVPEPTSSILLVAGLLIGLLLVRRASREGQ